MLKNQSNVIEGEIGTAFTMNCTVQKQQRGIICQLFRTGEAKTSGREKMRVEVTGGRTVDKVKDEME